MVDVFCVEWIVLSAFGNISLSFSEQRPYFVFCF